MLTAAVSAAEYLADLRGNDRREELVFGHRRHMPRIPCPNGAAILNRLGVIVSEHLATTPRVFTLLTHPIDLVLNVQFGLVLHPPLALVLAERIDTLHGARRVWGAPNLVVELLWPSSARRLRHTKLRWYGSYGVDELWMIDTRHQRVEVANYGRRKLPLPNLYSGDTLVESPLLPTLSFCAADLFGNSDRRSNAVASSDQADRRCR